MMMLRKPGRLKRDDHKDLIRNALLTRTTPTGYTFSTAITLFIIERVSHFVYCPITSKSFSSGSALLNFVLFIQNNKIEKQMTAGNKKSVGR